jgi:hypothetical protein
MKIQDAIHSLNRSSERLQAVTHWNLAEPLKRHIFKRETWIHLKRSFRLWAKSLFYRGG